MLVTSAPISSVPDACTLRIQPAVFQHLGVSEAGVVRFGHNALRNLSRVAVFCPLDTLMTSNINCISSPYGAKCYRFTRGCHGVPAGSYSRSSWPGPDRALAQKAHSVTVAGVDVNARACQPGREHQRDGGRLGTHTPPDTGASQNRYPPQQALCTACEAAMPISVSTIVCATIWRGDLGRNRCHNTTIRQAHDNGVHFGRRVGGGCGNAHGGRRAPCVPAASYAVSGTPPRPDCLPSGHPLPQDQ